MKNGKWYNIFLPAYYNDGKEIEAGKFETTREELVKEFGGLTAFSKPTYTIQGFWRFGDLLYSEEVRIFRVFSKNVNTARTFFEVSKKKLRQRFKQKEIFITETDLELL